MDIFRELFCLSIDSILFGIVYSKYSFFNKTLKRLKKAEKSGINPDPGILTDEERESVLIKGTVTALTPDLVHSFHSPQSQGVIQKIAVTEHKVTKNATGFWSDSKHVIQEITNAVPFGLKQGSYLVEVTDVRECYILDLETVAAKFEPTKLNTVDFLLGFFYGVRQHGIETTEEMLKEGTVITGIGELSVVNGIKTLSPPADGSGYILTVTPISSLMKRFKGEETTMKMLLFLFGAVGVVLVGLIIKHGYKFYLDKLGEKETKKRLEKLRQERRIAARENEEIPDGQRCVVCHHNPREILILPCGHLCLCEDCSINISNHCPICRGIINSKTPVFL